MIRRGAEHSQPPAAQQQGYTPSQPPSYGGGAQQPYYQSSNATPSAAWPVTTATSARSSAGGLAAMVALAAGALLGLAYAGWAFTARRGIFADFADGNAASTDDAKSSDTIDTVFLIVAGVVALVALGLWIARMASKQTKGGALDLTGIALAGLGLVAALIGLFLASTIGDADGQTAQGDKGVTATLVVGGGFALLAIGLLIGVSTVRGRGSANSRGGQWQAGAGYQTW